ncbi:MAG: hypothetical protein AB7F35_01930 [Acetobacteraceae bacterium]
MFSATALRGFVNTLQVNVADLNAKEASALLARVATAERDRVLTQQRARSGLMPHYRQIVDGKEGTPLTAVNPDGVIVFAWQYLAEIVRDTHEALVRRSPRGSGAYIAGLIILVDGQEAGIEAIDADTRAVHIVASVPYARRLEVGKRKAGGSFVLQVRSHIVEETAIVARRLAGNLASFAFTYVDLSDAYALRRRSGHRRRAGRMQTDVRYPAILITPRTA